MYNYDCQLTEKLCWDSSDKSKLLEMLNLKKVEFDQLTERLNSAENNIDDCINSFSNIIHDISYTCFGKKCNKNKKPYKQKAPWFDNDCREAKHKFLESKRSFKNSPSNENKINFLSSRQNFINLKRKKRNKHNAREKVKLSDMSRNSPRNFWKYIKKFGNQRDKSSNSINLNDFKEYFETVSNTSHKQYDAESFTHQRDYTLRIDMLDTPITTEEIIKTISNLKRNKSSDLDGNIAEFFIDTKEFISPYLCTIFNNIYDSGIYPEAWSRGFIVPIFKKGNADNPGNYRGITIVNIMSKIFSLLLRTRINKWCESNNVFNEAQYGFRDDRSTADAIFILHSIIQNVIANKLKLWCTFIDFERAFDTVIRDALWVKLVESGISCKMINMIKSIYKNVKTCIKLGSTMEMSEFFDVTLGVKQGEPLSPLLFILFVNDISNCIDINCLNANDLNVLSMFLILFADDIVLFTTDHASLQSQLDNLYLYSEKWGLKININKTKVCVFERRRNNSTNYNDVFINGEKVEMVDSFVYLGMKFYYTGNLSYAVNTLSEQALKAYHNLLLLFDRIDFDIKTKLYLFDSMVVPILLYGSEVSGIYNFQEIDKLHIRFCKYILGVKQQTPNFAVYGELGRFPISVLCKERAIKFWLKIMKNENSPIKSIYNEQILSGNSNNWAGAMKNYIDRLGFSHLLENFDPNFNYFPTLKQRIRDQFLQKWSETINSMQKLVYYKQFKTSFVFEDYLSFIKNISLRKQLSCMRLSSHSLEIEVGRYSNINRENRICRMCNQNTVETEYHFLLCCTKYSDIRKKYFGATAWPTLEKYKHLMSSKNKCTILKICKFIRDANSLRTDTLAMLTVS
jgi:hypothetical protein